MSSSNRPPRHGNYRRGRDTRGAVDFAGDDYDESEELSDELSKSEIARRRSTLERLPGSPQIVERAEHNISRRGIDSDALKVMYRLVQAGYLAFLVGGGVRDLLLGKKPKDFDVSTDASPELVRKLFRNSRIIGRRFRLNHVYFFGGKIVEVSTFRSAMEADTEGEGVLLGPDNTYGDPESDAFRRDLTINGLFYDVNSFSIIDYVGGLSDLNKKIIRIIGDPMLRFREDPVRMMRAIRHAARTGFTIEPVTAEAIHKSVRLIEHAPRARVFDELLKDFRGKSVARTFELYEEFGLIGYFIPSVLVEGKLSPLVLSVLHGIDKVTSAGAELSPAVMFSALAIASSGGMSEFIAPDDPVWRYLEISPDGEIRRSSDTADESLPPIRSRRRSGGYGGQPRKKLGEGSKLERLLAEIFRPIGVSRKDTEKAELLLALRYEMFRGWQGYAQEGYLESSRDFGEALLLARITAVDDTSWEVFHYWDGIWQQARRESSPIIPRHHNRNPRGGGRGRRR